MISRLLQKIRGKTEQHKTSPDFSTANRAYLEADKWAASELAVQLSEIIAHRPYPLDELMLMIAAFAYHQPEVVIDIGTHLGKSARVWWELDRHFGTQATIHTIDIFNPAHIEYPGEELGLFCKETSVVQHIGDGYAVAEQLIAEAPEKRYLLFLDGDHAYDSVLQELELARRIRNSGVLLHDTFYQPRSTYNHGPYEAMQAFLPTFQCKQVVYLQTGLPGMAYIGIE